MEDPQNSNFHEIGGEDEDDRRSIRSSHNSEPILPERIETERMSKDKAVKKCENNKAYTSIVNGENAMDKSQNPNFHGIGREYGDDKRSMVGNSHNSEPILPERIETERMLTAKDRKSAFDRAYRQREKRKLETLKAENCQLKSQIELLKQEMLVNQRLENSRNGEPILPERIETERMSKDKADKRRENNKAYTRIVNGENSMEKSQNPNSHGIGGEYGGDKRSTVGNLQSREPEGIEMSMDKAFKKRQNNRVYRQRKKSKMDTLEAETKELKSENGRLKDENCQLKSHIELLNGKMELLCKRLEIQSKELDGLRKMCDKLEEKNTKEHERIRRLESKLEKRKAKIENVNGKYVQLLEQCKVNPTFESRSNEMPQQLVAPQVQSAQVAPENYTPLWANTLSWLPEPEDYALENHAQMQVAEDYPPMQVAPGNNTAGPVE